MPLPPESWETVAPVALDIPNIVVGCGPLSTGLRRGCCVSGLHHCCFDGSRRLGSFWRRQSFIRRPYPQAQAVILFVALGAYFLAALFSERRESETRLADANTMLERERDNKLMNLEALAASISHEIKQPLTAILANAGAISAFLGDAPPNIDEARAAAIDISDENQRASEAINSIHSLFGRANQRPQWVDMNDIILETLHSLRLELMDRGVAVHPELTSDLPPVTGHQGQLREVVLNLVHNALDAMAEMAGRSANAAPDNTAP